MMRSEELFVEFNKLQELCAQKHISVGDAFNLCAQVFNQPEVGEVEQKTSILQEESSSPYNPYYKEEDTPTSPKKEKKRKKKLSEIPSWEEVEEYHLKQGFNTFSAVAFYDYYDQYGWVNKDGNPVCNWQALMRGWERSNLRRMSEETDTQEAKKARGGRVGGRSATGQSAEAEAELQQYVEANYPLDKEGVTDEQRQALDAFSRTYAPSNEGAFRKDAVMAAVRDGKVQDLANDAKRVGNNMVIRTVINQVKGLVLCVNGNLLRITPSLLSDMALRILRAYPYLTMPDLMLAFSRFKKGLYGDFRGRLTPVRLMEAMGKFVSWRTEQLRYLS